MSRRWGSAAAALLLALCLTGCVRSGAAVDAAASQLDLDLAGAVIAEGESGTGLRMPDDTSLPTRWIVIEGDGAAAEIAEQLNDLGYESRPSAESDRQRFRLYSEEIDAEIVSLEAGSAPLISGQTYELDGPGAILYLSEF